MGDEEVEGAKAEFELIQIGVIEPPTVDAPNDSKLQWLELPLHTMGCGREKRALKNPGKVGGSENSVFGGQWCEPLLCKLKNCGSGGTSS